MEEINLNNWLDFKGYSYENKCFKKRPRIDIHKEQLLYKPSKNILKTYLADLIILSSAYDYYMDLGDRWMSADALYPRYINLPRKEKVKFMKKNIQAEFWEKVTEKIKVDDEMDCYYPINGAEEDSGFIYKI